MATKEEWEREDRVTGRYPPTSTFPGRVTREPRRDVHSAFQPIPSRSLVRPVPRHTPAVRNPGEGPPKHSSTPDVTSSTCGTTRSGVGGKRRSQTHQDPVGTESRPRTHRYKGVHPLKYPDRLHPPTWRGTPGNRNGSPSR